MNADAPKFCKDCKFISPLKRNNYPVCLHEKAREPDYYVAGEVTGLFSCSAMRAGICGIEGRLWEAIAPNPPNPNAVYGASS